MSTEIVVPMGGDSDILVVIDSSSSLISFKDLLDLSPKSYDGKAGQLVVVNEAENGVGFTDDPPIGDAIQDALDLKADKATTINGHALGSNITLDTSDIEDSEDKRYVTDAQLLVLSHASGTNTGDETLAANSGLVLSSHVLAMGTPSTVSATTTNGVSTSTHTHALSISKSDIGLGDVENTAISTWHGTTSIDTVGTISSGVWNGDVLLNEYIPVGLVGKTYNGIEIVEASDGFTISGGTTSSRTLTVISLNATISGNNSGDVSLGTASGLILDGQELSMTAATTSSMGAVQLSNLYSSSSPTLAVTEKALSDGLASVCNGPSSAVNETIVVFDGTTGKLIKSSGVTISNFAPLQIPDRTEAASAENKTFFRYVETSNSSALAICMKSGTSSYVWEEIMKREW